MSQITRSELQKMKVAELKEYARERFGFFDGSQKAAIIDSILSSQEQGLDQIVIPGSGPGETLEAIKSNSRFSVSINPDAYMQISTRLPPPRYVTPQTGPRARDMRTIVITGQNVEEVPLPTISTAYKQKRAAAPEKIMTPAAQRAPQRQISTPITSNIGIDIDMDRLEESRGRGKGYKLDELKAFASQLGLKTSGRKDDLISRIQDELRKN